MGIGPGGRRAGPLELMTRGYDGGLRPYELTRATGLIDCCEEVGRQVCVLPYQHEQTDRQARVTARTASSLACRYRVEGRVDVRRGYGWVKPILEQLE